MYMYVVFFSLWSCTVYIYIENIVKGKRYDNYTEYFI